MMIKASCSQMDSEVLALDSYTLKDLEIFESDTGDSLFKFCNLSRTAGGSRVLRRRMENPWCSADHIRSTQDSISFILAQRDAFTLLPSAFLLGRVERYSNEILPIVTQENTIAFTLNAFVLWADHDRHYASIVNGVAFTCKLIRALRQFIARPELTSPVGEIALIFEELQTLLSRPRLSRVPDEGTEGWFLNALRLDQIFRLYEKDTISRLVQLTYEIDALVAMADVTRKHEFVLPHIEAGSLRVYAEGVVHPYIEKAVANPVKLDQKQRVLFLTGPNMAGKTTYLRAFGTALYLAHLGMGVPARSFSFVPAQHLFTSISLNDNLHSGVSYFRAEALRIKAIAEAVVSGYRVVALLDEPFKGTNVKDAIDASRAILESFARKQGCLFMFSSHLIELGEKLDDHDQMDYRYFEADEGEGRLGFDYLLHAGISSQRLGMRVLHEEGIFDLLDGSPKDGC